MIPDLSSVLHTSGQLEQNAEYRIRSTAAMIFPVMMHGGLSQRGAGVAQVLKVRLIHATIRNLILHGSPQDAVKQLLAGGSGQVAAQALPVGGGRQAMFKTLYARGWNLQGDGLPCNQEELAYTLLTFGYVFLRSLRRLGIGLRPADEEAYLHAWNVVGHILGIDRALMVDTMDQGQALMARMQARGRAEPVQPDPRPALGRALMQTMENSLPWSIVKPFPELMTRYLCGRDTANDLGLTQPVPWPSALLFWGVLLIARAIDTLLRMVLPRFSIVRTLTRILGYHFMSRVLMSQTRPLQLPTELLNQVDDVVHSWSDDPPRPRLAQPDRRPVDHPRQLEPGAGAQGTGCKRPPGAATRVAIVSSRPMYPLLCALLMLVRHWHARRGVATALLWVIVPMVLPLGVQAAPPLVLAHERPQVDAWEAITLKADPSYQLSVQDMLSQLRAFDTPAQRGGSIGVHKAAMWLHIPIIAPEALRTPWVVNIGYSSLQAELFLARDGKVLQQVHKKEGNQTQLSSRTPAMVLDLQPGQRYDLLIRVQATGPLILPIAVSEMPVYLHQSLGEQLLQGLLNGLALCLLAYSLVQWVTQRDRMFAFYALVVLGSMGFSMQFFGIGPQYLWPDNPWMNRYSGPAAGLMALVGSFLFLGHMLADSTQKSRYARTMRAGAAITSAVCGALLFGWLSVPFAIAFMSLAGPLPSIISLPAAIARVRQKDPIGMTLLLAWIAFGVAAGVMVCLVQGWVPANFWTLHSFQFGATLDMLLFFRVLGLRAQAAKAQAQEAMRERDLMHSLANTDPLTGLSNRRGLNIALASALSRCSPERMLAVYVMDLDGFKPVNDQHGHDVGDELLIAVTRRLQGHVRQSDLVARLGGDEFVVMAGQLHSLQQAQELGNKLLDAFRAPFSLQNVRVEVGLTIGYAIAPHDGNDAIGLLKLADAAMYSGKQGGKFCLRRNTGDLALSSS